jgi:hypothetical protein
MYIYFIIFNYFPPKAPAVLKIRYLDPLKAAESYNLLLYGFPNFAN